LLKLKDHVRAQGITLEFASDINPALGVSCGGHIKIRPFMPAASEFATLVHEYAHERMHRGERRVATSKCVRETEAEAVAFVVCEAIDLDTNTASSDYIRLYSGDRKTLAESLEFIQSTAAEILTALGVVSDPAL
jgi:hypothetical protein